MQPKLSVVIPIYDHEDEICPMIESVRNTHDRPEQIEFILLDLRGRFRHAPANTIIQTYSVFPGLGRARNDAIAMSRSEFILFLYPGLSPEQGAIGRLIAALEQHPKVGAAAGRWRNAVGVIEKGYNVRRFPTPSALAFDVLLINKMFPRNRVTRAYKMHDFDHEHGCEVEHANDCAFLIRRSALEQAGAFKESYRPGWFDQVEFCKRLLKCGFAIAYVPQAEFVASPNPPLINRLVRDYYVDFYRAEYEYAARTFGRWRASILKAAIIIGMAQRLLFVSLPDRRRLFFLRRFRSYVSDEYIRGLRRTYWNVLHTFCR